MFPLKIFSTFTPLSKIEPKRRAIFKASLENQAKCLILLRKRSELEKKRLSILPHHFDNKDYYLLKFVYDDDLISVARSLGCRWVVNAGGWAIYRTPENLKALQRAFRDMAIVDTSKVGVPMTSEEENNLFESIPKAYVQALRDEQIDESKLVVYCSLLREFLLFYGDKKSSELGIEDFRNYLDHQVGLKKLSGGIQSKTRNAIGLFYEKVLGWNKEDLCLETEKPSEELPDLLSPEDLSRLLKATNNVKYKAMISLLYESDLSVDDLSGLRLRSIDLNKKAIEISDGREEKSKFLFLAKNSKELLSHYLTLYKPQKWLFERTKTAEKYLPEKIHSLIRQFAFQAGLGNMIKPYNIKQSYTKTLKEKGLSKSEIRSLLGDKELKRSSQQKVKDADQTGPKEWGS